MAKAIAFSIALAVFFFAAHAEHAWSASDNPDLISAIKSGNAQRVGQLLADGANPNARIQEGMTALIGAAFEGNPEIVRLLLDSGAKIDEKTDLGVTALMMAAVNNRLDVVRLLLAKGADANVRERGGHTAFELAAAKGNAEVAELLLKRTKGTADWRIKTVIGPLDTKQKCLPVTKAPDEASPKVGCLVAGREVTTGASNDSKWAVLKRPVSGWVPAEKLNRTLVSRIQIKPSVPISSAGHQGFSSVTDQAGAVESSAGATTSDEDAVPTGGRGGAWWKHQ